MFLNYLIYIFVVILCKIQPKITANKIIGIYTKSYIARGIKICLCILNAYLV